jgi:NADH:ubiquinone oxidoreductase subunit 5 (subunit L)/multisubunit Na+/H+ antiporter MnhA subunit
MIYLAFHGSWRGPAEAWHHVHESAPTMVAPLVILVVPTVLAGLLLGLPPESGQIHVWLEEVFHGAEELGTGILPGSIAAEALAQGEHHEFEWLGLGGLLLLIGAAVGAGGILLARRWYTQDLAAPARFVDRIPFGLGPGMYRASLNKYYFDDLYQLLFARGGVLISNALWWFDVKVIDGLVNGSGWLAQRIGGVLRRVQTGRVQNYGLGIAAGLVVVLLVYAVVVR